MAGLSSTVQAGDTLVLPARVERQIFATTAVRVPGLRSSGAVVRVLGEDAPRGTPPGIA
ncbi:MAG: hypothetical protein WBP81_18995 [Solirubrobacteraceae bacterium]